MSRFDDDQFLKDVYEEPHPTFVETLWNQLSAQDGPVAPGSEKVPTNALLRFTSEEEVKMEKVDFNRHSRRNGAYLVKARERHQPHSNRLSWVAMVLILVLGLVVFLAAAGLFSTDTSPIHLSDIGAQQITPTTTASPSSSVTGSDQETVHDALLSGDRPLPEVQFDLGEHASPTNFSLSAKQRGVRLRFTGQTNTHVAITLELATYVPRTGIAVRMSRFNGRELQPLLIFKPEQLASLPVYFPIAFVDAEQQADVIVELLTPLASDEELFFRAYLGFPWSMPAIQPFPGSVSCIDYPTYCVPLVGGGEDAFSALESSTSRSLDQSSSGSPGVIRGIGQSGAPLIGDPDAPLHLAVFMDLSSIHDAAYYLSDLQPFITDYVLTGQASLEMILVPDPTEEFARNAAAAAFTAGEQGAFWEMITELFELAKSGGGPRYAFSSWNIYSLAEYMGLNTESMLDDSFSEQYDELFSQFRTLAETRGDDEMPAVLFQTSDETWQSLPDRSYEALAQAARTPELLDHALPVSIVLDPEIIDQVAFGLQEGDQVQLRFDVSELESEPLSFEAMLVTMEWLPNEQGGFLGLIFAVSPQDTAAVVELLDAEVPVTVVLADSR